MVHFLGEGFFSFFLSSGPNFALEAYIRHSQPKTKFVLHGAGEVPDLRSHGQRMERGKTYNVMASVSQMDTDEGAMTLESERRNCLAEKERELQIFANYTQVSEVKTECKPISTN